MTFTEAENKFRELQSRVQRGEHLSEQEYENELAKLMVQDQHGTFWSPDPETGRWLYFNGTEWVPGTPPREEQVASVAPREKKAEPAASIPATLPEPAHIPADPVSSFEPTVAPPTETEPILPVVGSADPVLPDVRTGGVPVRPTRTDQFPSSLPNLPGERPWLPFALGAIVFALCGLILFFAGRQFLSGNVASPTNEPTRTIIAAIQPTAIVPATTPTRAATNTPPPPLPSPTSNVVLGKVNADPLNVRGGPGATHGIIGKLMQGTQVKLLAKSQDGAYFQIEYPEPGKVGWVAKQFVDLVSGSVDSLPTIIPTPTPSLPTPAPKPTQPKPTETPAG